MTKDIREMDSAVGINSNGNNTNSEAEYTAVTNLIKNINHFRLIFYQAKF